MPPFLGLLQLLAIGALGFWAITVLYTAWSLLHPPKRTYAWALHRNQPGDPSELDTPLEYEQIELKSNNQTLTAWKIKALNPTGPRILMIHGWGSSSIGALPRIPHLQSLASEIITLDLPGHGQSTGTAQMGTSEHADIDTLLSSLDDSNHPTPTIIYGWSMGAGIAIKLAKDHATDHNIKAVIAESPYIHAITPARNVIHLRGLPTKLNLKPAITLIGILKGVGPKWHGFARDQLAKDLPVPLLIIQGQQDPVSPLADAKAIAAVTPNATLLEIEHAGHNNIWTTPDFTEQANQAIAEFIKGATA